MLALAACVPPGMPPPQLWHRLGGQPAVEKVVDDLFTRVAADPVLRHRFAGQNLEALKSQVVSFLCDNSGGPCRYQGRDMRTAHAGMTITATEWEAFMADARHAVDRNNIVGRERAELLALIESTRNDIVAR
jgi:hemoglobin